ncbi:alpha/beta hydrolase [Acidisoma cellulosilytica]|uniref:Alpha/beta hydrolase n=1 Tax=Acidisoma cellulosilyticum TaxID=2802395 RepID=A0A963YY11_9PROT|nr:alpha/beta hydrolase [Acidisoma cellulosilyticum]MCB8879337.1 alpha/beta hydrolase [Acidisoma cellulosilyticum]
MTAHLTRRAALAALATGLVLPSAARAEARDIIPLWPDGPPGGGGPAGPERISTRGAISHIAIPHLRVYRPENPTGAAVLVAAGGGYRHIEMGMEAAPAAHWLAARGITAFALLYRLPDEGWSAGPYAPLQDAQRAMRLVRAQAGLQDGRIGVLGFSSGGHLMGMTATRFDKASYAPVDAVDRLSARPDNAALIYPVITLEPPYDNTSTRRVLIGQTPSAAESADWSVQTAVRKNGPPVFLVQADDDPISNPANTRIMAQACAKADVPVEWHRLAQGGHGFGMGQPGSDTALWPGWYQEWLQRQGML